MSTIRLPHGIITLSDCYRYKNVTFEWHRYCGPMLLKKNTDPAKSKPGPKFYAIVHEWRQLPAAEREKFRV